MRPRIGVSLIECLVALVLLVVGLSAATLTMLTASRLARVAHDRREAALAALRELARFVSAPCPTRDTSWVRTSADGIVERWTLVVGTSTVALHGSVSGGGSRTAQPLPIEVHRRCG